MVGAIVDPAVDGDGLNLTGPGAPGRTFSAEETEHPVRARLLDRARGRGQQPEVEATPDLTERLSEDVAPKADPAFVDPPPSVAPTRDEPAVVPVPVDEVSQAPVSTAPLTPPPAAVASELDRIARRPAAASNGPGLSPNLIAILGGLLGLTVITTLGVFLGRSEVKSLETPVEAPQESAPEPPPEEPEVKRPERKKIEGPWRIEDDAKKPGHRVISGKIGKNAFLTAIQDAGLPKSEAYRAYGALKSEKDLDHCKSTDTFLALVSGNEKTLIAFEYLVSKEEVYQVRANEEGKLEGTQLDLKVGRNQIRRSFTHDGTSFEESARRAGFDPGISDAAEESLRGHSSLSDFKRGDRLRIIAQEVTVLGEFSRYAGIEAMEILREGEDPRRIYYFPHPVEGGHFDKNGRAPYEGGWRKPIPSAPRTSPFNPKRMHPILKKVQPHNGTDYGAPTGTPIGATAPGVVTFRAYAGATGNYVKIQHEGGYESGYAHLSKFASDIKVGDRVERMQTIGYCGTTGRSTGPHLHFVMKKDGKYIDPESMNLDGLRVLPKEFRAEFAEVRAKYDPLLDQIPLPEPLAAPADPAPGESAEPAEVDQDAAPDDASNGMIADESPSTTPAPQAAAPPAPAAPSAPATPATAQAPSAIFLSDSELLKMQSVTDDGEVAQ